jgi:hypothetical protein
LQHGAALVKKANHEGTASLLNSRGGAHTIDNMLFQTAAKASSIESLKRLTQGSFSHGTVRRQTARKAVATCVALQSFPLHHAA